VAERADLFTVFSPARELEQPDRFAGRKAEVLRLTDSLQVPGSCPLIYGHRGLGKSSLALQIDRIAQGDVELLAELGNESRGLPEDGRFLVLWVTCTDTVQGIDDVLQLMINAAEDVDMLDADSASPVLVDRTSRRKLSLKAFEFETVRRYEDQKARTSHQLLSVSEVAGRLCQLLTDIYGQPVLVIVDELDRVRRTDGLASFIKASSSNQLKFLLVGIGNTISDLLADHQSLERHVVAVQVPLMKDSELIEIVSRAEHALIEMGHVIRFADEAKLLLARVAAGFPWFVHVLGQKALVWAYDAGETTVSETAVSNAVKWIVRDDFAQQFSDTYQLAVRNSYQREIVLRACAEWPQADIPIREIYKIARTLNVTNPSVHKRQLCETNFGNVLFLPSLQSGGLVRFSNEMFKAYVRLRPSLHGGIDAQVREAFGR
jgi:type II secretory pathway predicted ATPase ExeA